MLKIEQLFHSIQLRNHLSLLINSNAINFSQEKKREVNGIVKKIDNLVLESSSEAIKELEEVSVVKKVIKIEAEESDEKFMSTLPNKLNTIVDNATKIAKDSSDLEIQKQIKLEFEKDLKKKIDEKRIDTESNKIKSEEVKPEEKSKKKTSKSKTKEELLEGQIEAVSLEDVKAPVSLSEVQKSGKKGIFRRKQ